MDWSTGAENGERQPQLSDSDQNRFGMVVIPECRELKRRISATISGWDCPLLTFIYPGFDCGSTAVLLRLQKNFKKTYAGIVWAGHVRNVRFKPHRVRLGGRASRRGKRRYPSLQRQASNELLRSEVSGSRTRVFQQ